MRICQVESPQSDPPASKILYLLRAAEPSRSASASRSPSGLGAYLRAAHISPAMVLCSSAGPAQDALEDLWPFLPGPPLLSTPTRLLRAGADELLAMLRDLRDDLASVLVIAHDPGLTELALKLSRGYGPRVARAARHKLFRAFPDGTFAALKVLKPSWAELGPKAGVLTTVVRPDDFTPQDL